MSEPAKEGVAPAAAAVPAAPATSPAATATDAAPKPAAAAPVAKKPPAAKPVAKKQEDRRFILFAPIYSAWTWFALAVTAQVLAVVRFMFPNVLAEPPSQFRVGAAAQFEPGSVDERWKYSFQVWIVNLKDEKRLIALSTICTHLGCSPSWLEAEQKFKCPCHGSGFYKNGINFEGPAPRPLERFAISEVDGVVVIDKSKKFQQELNQWDDAQSFIRTG